MLYNYLLLAFQLLVALMSENNLLINVSIAAVAFYVVWVIFSLSASFQKKFSKNCGKLYKFIKSGSFNTNDLTLVDKKAAKISSGFLYGWKKFKSASSGKPSDYIKRQDALDVEVNGGVLNQGKSLMRAYINIATFVLFVINFALIGNKKYFSCYILAESFVLPFVFYIVCKVFYFVYTSVRQQFYKNCVESFYEAVDALDEVFGEKTPVVMVAQNQETNIQETPYQNSQIENVVLQEYQNPVQEEYEQPKFEEQPVQENLEVLNKESEEVFVGEEQPETEPEPVAPAEEESQEDLTAERYDFFKRKNIDVDKLTNEVPERSSSLPFINVDSDYVIKDQGFADNNSIINLENDGDLIDNSIIDYSKNEEVLIENESAEEPLTDVVESQEAVNENDVENFQEENNTEDIDFENQDNNLVALNAFDDAEESAEDEQTEDEADMNEDFSLDVDSLDIDDSEEDDEEIEDNANEVEEDKSIDENIDEDSADADEDDLTDEERESLASIVDRFKKNVDSYKYNEEQRDNLLNTDDEALFDEFNQNYVEEKFDNQNPANYSNNVNDYNSAQGIYNQPYMPNYNNHVFGYNPQPFAGQAQNYQDPYVAEKETQEVEEKPVKKAATKKTTKKPAAKKSTAKKSTAKKSTSKKTTTKKSATKTAAKKATTKKAASKTATKKAETKNTRKKASKTAMAETKTTKRGRPKKQIFDDNIRIQNDEEFDQVLFRAEKLMKKSEEGLSASQSKRIEKELKMLMDAMNKYKEGN